MINNSSQNDKASKPGYFGQGIQGGGTMSESQIRSIVQDEMNKNYMSGNPRIPRHFHNGNDNPKISQSDVVPAARASGSITFAHTGKYVINLNSNPKPTLVLCYGTVTDGLGFTFTATLPLNYIFTVTSANATAGATYTNNGQTFTVSFTISGMTTLTTTGTGTPTSSGTLTKATGTGDSTISFSFVSHPANASAGAQYSNNGQIFTVVTTTTGGTTLATNGSGNPSTSGFLSKISGSGDNSIAFSSVSNSITVRAHTMGSAQLGSSYFLQPNTNSSVVPGANQSLIQSSSYISVDNGGNVHALTDEGHLVDVEFGGTIHARMTVIDSNTSTLTVNVDNLDSGWEILVNLVII